MKVTSISNGKGSDNNKELQDLISRLPLDCLRTVIMLTSPKDACRSAAVCTTFLSAADSDDVWESFLPADLSSILYRAETDVQQLPVSKKELYLHLCHNWILLDGGTKFGGKKSLRLDLLSGAKIIMLRKQYPSTKDPIETRIEIKEAIDCKDLSPKMNYAAYIIFTGMPKSRRVLEISQCVFDNSIGSATLIYGTSNMNIWRQESQTREDGWREIKLGEFNTGTVGEDRVVHFFIYDANAIIQINDLIFGGIEVRPVC